VTGYDKSGFLGIANWQKVNNACVLKLQTRPNFFSSSVQSSDEWKSIQFVLSREHGDPTGRLCQNKTNHNRTLKVVEWMSFHLILLVHLM